jgi:hypothetical protein
MTGGNQRWAPFRRPLRCCECVGGGADSLLGASCCWGLHGNRGGARRGSAASCGCAGAPSVSRACRLRQRSRRRVLARWSCRCRPCAGLPARRRPSRIARNISLLLPGRSTDDRLRGGPGRPLLVARHPDRHRRCERNRSDDACSLDGARRRHCPHHREEVRDPEQRAPARVRDLVVRDGELLAKPSAGAREAALGSHRRHT